MSEVYSGIVEARLEFDPSGIIAAKSKPFVVHLNVLSYNNCPSIGRYLFVNPVESFIPSFDYFTLTV